MFIEYSKRVQFLSKLVGVTEIVVKSASYGSVFTKTSKRHKFTYKRENEDKSIALGGPTSDADFALYYWLKFLYSKQQGLTTCEECSGRGVVTDNRGSSYNIINYGNQSLCHCCGGYKIGSRIPYSKKSFI